MRKKLLVAALVVAGQVSAEVVVQEGNISVDSSELELAVQQLLLPAQKEAVTRQLESLERFVGDYVLLKRIGQLATERGLDTDQGLVIRLEHEKNRMLTQLLLADELAAEKQPDFTLLARESYILEPEKFVVPEQVHARHILLTQNDDETSVEFLLRAQQVQERVRKQPGRFVELAREYSQDPSVEQNDGDLGFFSREQMVRPFSDAAFALKKNAISEPVKTRFGYHIIQLVDKKPAGKKSFDEVKEQLINEAMASYETKRKQEIMTRLRGEASAKMDTAALQRLQGLLQKK